MHASKRYTFLRPNIFLSWLVLFANVMNPGVEAKSAPYAENKQPRFLTLISENDNYVPARQDRHYTNGLYLSYGLPRGQQPWWLNWLGNMTPLADRIQDREYNIAIGQNLYTPEVFTSPKAIPGDRPFAGWLYGGLSVTAHSPGIEEHLAVNIGVVGLAAQGRRTQKLLHEISGDPEPQGWHNQLENEPALLLRYQRSWFTALVENQPVNLDLVPRAGLTTGNVITEAGAGAQSRVIAHNIFLDGNTFEDSLSVDRKTLAGSPTIRQTTQPCPGNMLHLSHG